MLSLSGCAELASAHRRHNAQVKEWWHNQRELFDVESPFGIGPFLIGGGMFAIFIGFSITGVAYQSALLRYQVREQASGPEGRPPRTGAGGRRHARTSRGDRESSLPCLPPRQSGGRPLLQGMRRAAARRRSLCRLRAHERSGLSVLREVRRRSPLDGSRRGFNAERRQERDGRAGESSQDGHRRCDLLDVATVICR